MTTYPTLRIGVLQSLIELKAQLAHDNQLLELEVCPYDRETVTALKTIFTERVVERVVEKEVVRVISPEERADTKMSLSDQEEVAESARELLSQLKVLGEGETGLDTQTKIQIIKTKATLMEQLVKLRERWMNVKRQSQFHAVVIGILDDLLAENDRAEFLRRLEPFRE